MIVVKSWFLGDFIVWKRVYCCLKFYFKKKKFVYLRLEEVVGLFKCFFIYFI